jgi:cation diffusion facilitator family transporter
MIVSPEFLQANKLRLIAAISIAVALCVMTLKYIAYLKTGSVALYSDALESIVNVTTALTALWAVVYAERPADRNHPFGHHKAEYFSAVVSGVLIVFAAFLILHQAWDAFQSPKPIHAHSLGALYNGLATALNAGWAALLIVKGRAWRSPALMADGWHILTDVTTSVALLIGFALMIVTGWQILDPLMAVLAAASILWSGWSVTRQSFSGLMDESVTSDILTEIQRVIAAEGKGALEAHDLRTRHAGRATFIEFHLVVDGEMSVRMSHDICDRIEAALRAKIEGARVTIHVEPEEKAKHSGIAVP